MMTSSLQSHNHAPEQCPLCHKNGVHYAVARDIEYFTSNNAFDFFHCVACDILFIAPMPKDDLSTIYPANYYSFAAGGKQNLVGQIKEWLDRRAFQSVLRKIEGQNLSLLDVGGGQGWLAALMRKADPRITRTHIVDIDPAAEQLARAQGHGYFCGPIEAFDTTDKFDVIMMLNLIEHVPDPRAVLVKARALLSPRGVILMKTPNFRALDARLFRHHNWGGYHCPRHFVLFCEKSLKQTILSAGLCVQDFSYTQGAPFWSISVLDMLRRFGLVQVSAQRPAIYHPLTPLLQAVGAAFDFARKPFFRLSQMIVVAGRNDK